MRLWNWIAGAVVLFSAFPGHAATREIPLTAEKTLVLLGRDHGADAIVEAEHDPFFRSLTRVDAELRLAEPLPDTTAEHRFHLLQKLFRDSVVEWTVQEAQFMEAACRPVLAAAERISPKFIPHRWKFIKTDGSEESHAAYTRHDAIILPAAKLPADPSPGSQYRLAKLIAHEASHVFSRLYPEMRDRLYGRLGFRHVGPIELGEYLENRRITNPDGVLLEHVIEVQHPQRGSFPAVLAIYSKSDRFSPDQGRRIFDYLQSGLFPVVQEGQGYRVVVGTDGVPPVYRPQEVTGFFEKIGRNTNYIIHPDEILAENLSLLLTEGMPGRPANAVADPKLLRDLAEILSR